MCCGNTQGIRHLSQENFVLLLFHDLLKVDLYFQQEGCNNSGIKLKFSSLIHLINTYPHQSVMFRTICVI